MNRLAQALAEICRERPLAEKWLIAPSLRIGRQWLDAVTRSGQSIINVRPATLMSLAIERAAPAMTGAGLTFLPARGGEMLVERILVERRKLGLHYLGRLEPSAGLSQAVYRAIQDLRQAGLTADDLASGLFEVAEKGRDLRQIVRDYLNALRQEGWIDNAGVLELAAQQGQSAGKLPAGTLLLIPQDAASLELERRFRDSFPPESRLILPVDEPADENTPLGPSESDRDALRWLPLPKEAPAPRRDGAARITCAVGEVNEVRNVLRTCIAGQIPWDEVELLHTDSNTYIPLVFEVLSALTTGDDPDEFHHHSSLRDEFGGVPATFAEGIPVRYSRPGRALALWIGWIVDDFPQDTFLKMLREGLLEIPVVSSADGPPSISRLARLFRRVGIGFSRARYLSQLADRRTQLEYKRDHPELSGNEDEEAAQERRAALERQLTELKTLEKLCQRLLTISPAVTASPGEVLKLARRFLLGSARKITQLDNFALWRLIDQIDDMIRWLPADTTGTSINVWNWLSALPAETRVLGSGPRPGALHVAPFLAGGHSGRGHTFIVGLDDSRFPGGGLEDPLLLDQERVKLSRDLVTGGMALEERSREAVRLLARLRGRVTLSYSIASVTADREMFPSPLVVSAYRILSGDHAGEPSALTRWLAQQEPPASFAPRSAGESLGEAEWWIHRLCGGDQIAEPRRLVEARHPHLQQGRQAVSARLSSGLTEFDGLVPQAGLDLDPTRELSPGIGASVMSAHRLTTIGRCPLAFFFQHGLSIEAPEPVSIDPEVWLDHSALGLLLHELFESFMRKLVERDQTPDFDRDRPRLLELLEVQIELYRRKIPPPRQSAFRKQCELLRETADTFLREEQTYCQQTGARPVYLEASLGMDPGEEHQTPLDTPAPMPLVLSSGRSIWLRGRIDRVDELPSPPGSSVRTFAIWDYKTGGTWSYNQADPFRQGRVLQPYLYVTLVEHRLRQVHGAARVGQFGFFFPARRAAGERISWSPDELIEGAKIVELLARVVAGGAFLATDNPNDCTFCDFRAICGNVEALAAASYAKHSVAHPLLAPHRELRPQ